MKESAVTSHIRLEAAQMGIDLWRNNSGGFYDENGRFIRFGLGGFTDRDEKKSSDYIGITPTLITPDMVGKVVGIFTAVEMKPDDWKLQPSDKRGIFQQNFINLVKSLGGYAGFARNITEFKEIVGHGKKKY